MSTIDSWSGWGTQGASPQASTVDLNGFRWGLLWGSKPKPESETNSPYIVVGTYESECRPNNPEGADLPDTPSLACAYVQGLLDGNLGQIVSFQSTYKSTLRIEVPVWPDVHQAVLSPVQAQPQPSFSGTISPVTT